MFLSLLLLLFLNARAQISQCSIGVNQHLPLADVHTYFLYCVEIDESNVLTMPSCLQITWDKYANASINVTQSCGKSSYSFFLVQTVSLYSNPTCSASETQLLITQPNGLSTYIQGCWETIRLQSYLIGSLATKLATRDFQQIGLDVISRAVHLHVGVFQRFGFLIWIWAAVFQRVL
jgi:hypothetical protein